MENPVKMNDFGGTIISGNIHIISHPNLEPTHSSPGLQETAPVQ